MRVLPSASATTHVRAGGSRADKLDTKNLTSAQVLGLRDVYELGREWGDTRLAEKAVNNANKFLRGYKARNAGAAVLVSYGSQKGRSGSRAWTFDPTLPCMLCIAKTPISPSLLLFWLLAVSMHTCSTCRGSSVICFFHRCAPCLVATDLLHWAQGP